MANQFLSLSLFLMLLSFFIVLNSMSDFEKKKAVPAVLNSLILTFSGQPQEVQSFIGPSSVLTDDESGSMEGSTLDSLEGLFNANIAGFVTKRNKLGTVMHVNLPMQNLENAVKSSDLNNISSDKFNKPLNFTQTMITLLRSAQAEDPYRVDIVYNLADDPLIMSKSVPDTFVKSIKRVSALAILLEQKGLPKRMMSVGLKKGAAGYVDLYFYKYKPIFIDSLLNDKEHAGADAGENSKEADSTFYNDDVVPVTNVEGGM